MHLTPDIGNGFFEFVGAFFTWRNFAQLKRDKELKGVYWPTSAFFTLWGIWNIYYYRSIEQYFSWAGGIMLVIGNICWVVTAIRLVLRKRWLKQANQDRAVQAERLKSRDIYQYFEERPKSVLATTLIDAEDKLPPSWPAAEQAAISREELQAAVEASSFRMSFYSQEHRLLLGKKARAYMHDNQEAKEKIDAELKQFDHEVRMAEICVKVQSAGEKIAIDHKGKQINLNGRKMTWYLYLASYADVLYVAEGLKDRIYSMSVWGGKQNQGLQRILSPGQWVVVNEGMVLNCYDTSNA